MAGSGLLAQAQTPQSQRRGTTGRDNPRHRGYGQPLSALEGRSESERRRPSLPLSLSGSRCQGCSASSRERPLSFVALLVAQLFEGSQRRLLT